MRRGRVLTAAMLLLGALRAHVVIFDDLGLLKRMQPLAPGARLSGGVRTGNPPAAPADGRRGGMQQAPRVQMPKAVAAGRSPERSILSQAAVAVPVPVVRVQAPPARPMPVRPAPARLVRVAPVPRPAPRPARPGPERDEPSSFAFATPSRQPARPQRIVAPRRPQGARGGERTSATSVTTVISYVSSIPSSTPVDTPRPSIAVDSAALTSVNTEIPGGQPPPTSSAMAAIPGRAELDEKRLRDYVNDHDSSIGHANVARKSFLSMKIQESQNTNRRDETRLANLRRVYDEYQKRVEELGGEISRMRSSIATRRALLGNTSTAIRELESGIRENETQGRLGDMEMVRLEKAMNEERNRIELLKEKSAMLKRRLKRLSTDEDESVSRLRTSESKLGIYLQLAEGLENELRQLREDIDEVESAKRKGQEVLSRLEIEHNQYENDRHLPLFVRYT